MGQDVISKVVYEIAENNYREFNKYLPLKLELLG